jgi:hypothetical protein
MDQLVEKVLEDEAFFEASGGGVTVSGGEALMQMDVNRRAKGTPDRRRRGTPFWDMMFVG